MDKVKAFTVGAVDYIPKPFQVEELLVRVENHLSLQAAKSEVLKLNTELEQRVVQRTAQLEREIAERLRIKEQLLHVALHEPLTDLPNRCFLLQQLSHILNPTSQEFEGFVLMLISGTNLQLINNTLGHQVCDQLLVAMARRIETCLEQNTLLAHVDRETFALLFENFGPQDAIQQAQILQREFSLPFQLQDSPIALKTSIGIVQGSQAYQQPEHLLRDANNALSQAQIKGRCQVFNPNMHQQTLIFFEIQNDLHAAIDHQELTLVYQPIISLKTGQVIGVEALCRWHHPVRGAILPADFIPVAEETGLIIPLDRYVVRQACVQLKEWQRQNILFLDFKLHVNISAQQLLEPDWTIYFERVLTETQVNGENLAIEITEDALMKEKSMASACLAQLKDRHIHVSIDDFGTGYSSLSYLRHLKVANLKIDRSFIAQVQDSSENLEIVSAIISLAHNLSMTVIAEGIETEGQLEILKSLGCEFGQGYLFSKPVDSQGVTETFVAHYC